MRNPALFAAVAIACGGMDEDRFIEKAAAESCRFVERCYYAEYLDDYRDRDDCVDENIEDYEDLSDLFDAISCDYEEDEAPVCISAIRNAARTCESRDIDDMWEACEDVYRCRG